MALPFTNAVPGLACWRRKQVTEQSRTCLPQADCELSRENIMIILTRDPWPRANAAIAGRNHLEKRFHLSAASDGTSWRWAGGSVAGTAGRSVDGMSGVWPSGLRTVLRDCLNETVLRCPNQFAAEAQSVRKEVLSNPKRETERWRQNQFQGPEAWQCREGDLTRTLQHLAFGYTAAENTIMRSNGTSLEVVPLSQRSEMFGFRAPC